MKTKDEPVPYVWTEALYEFTQHLFWEPQHINRQSVRKRGETWPSLEKRLRQREVPLEAACKVFFSVLRPQLTSQLLRDTFGIDFAPDPRPVELFGSGANAPLHDYFQDDITMETSGERIFIEMKLGSKFSVSQVRKYLMAMAWSEENLPHKVPVLLFLSKESTHCQWTSKGWNVPTKERNLKRALHEIEQNPLLGVVGSKAEPYAARMAELANSIQHAEGTWNGLRAAVERHILDHEIPEVQNLGHGFLAELHVRGVESSTAGGASEAVT